MKERCIKCVAAAGRIAVPDNLTTDITRDDISRMTDTMSHRGPDGAGVWLSSDNKVGLGHRRLSIIDLSETAASL